MALRANATLTFTGYTVEDGGITLRFLCGDPGRDRNGGERRSVPQPRTR